MWIMFPCDHCCRKATISCYVFLFFPLFYSLSLTITGILGEFIAGRLKLIISARHSKYKRNYVMVFCRGPYRYNDLQRNMRRRLYSLDCSFMWI